MTIYIFSIKNNVLTFESEGQTYTLNKEDVMLINQNVDSLVKTSTDVFAVSNLMAIIIERWLRTSNDDFKALVTDPTKTQYVYSGYATKDSNQFTQLESDGYEEYVATRKKLSVEELYEYDLMPVSDNAHYFEIDQVVVFNGEDCKIIARARGQYTLMGTTDVGKHYITHAREDSLMEENSYR